MNSPCKSKCESLRWDGQSIKLPYSLFPCVEKVKYGKDVYLDCYKLCSPWIGFGEPLVLANLDFFCAGVPYDCKIVQTRLTQFWLGTCKNTVLLQAGETVKPFVRLLYEFNHSIMDAVSGLLSFLPHAEKTGKSDVAGLIALTPVLFTNPAVASATITASLLVARGLTKASGVLLRKVASVAEDAVPLLVIGLALADSALLENARLQDIKNAVLYAPIWLNLLASYRYHLDWASFADALDCVSQKCDEMLSVLKQVGANENLQTLVSQYCSVVKEKAKEVRERPTKDTVERVTSEIVSGYTVTLQGNGIEDEVTLRREIEKEAERAVASIQSATSSAISLFLSNPLVQTALLVVLLGTVGYGVWKLVKLTDDEEDEEDF